MDGKNRPLIRFLCLITTDKLAKHALELFDEEGIALKYGLLAEGTASSELLDMMGLGSTEKRLLVSTLTKGKADSMLLKLSERLQLMNANSGIAFTIPINGLNNLMLKLVTHGDGKEALQEQKNDAKGDVDNMSDKKHALIAALINRGFSAEVMVAAREAGAGGGTVLHSRQIINEESASIWGIGLQEEKEILLIISDSEHRLDIMKAISEKYGSHSKAEGMVVSLPIDSVM